jgi:hypothetical protein
LNAGGSFLEILNGSVNIPTIQEGAQDQPNQYIDIRNVELSFGKFDRLTLNGDWVVDEIREIDAINPRQTVLTQGKSVLKDTGASTVAWTDENWKEFLECLKFKDTADLVGELTKGQIDLDDESMADSPLYGYTVTNITSSMFCNIKNNYENIFGSDVDLLVKNIAFEVEPTEDDIINVTITSKEEDSISFHSSGWFSLIENYQPNTNTTTVPDVSTMDVNDFLAQVGNDGITLVSSFTK